MAEAPERPPHPCAGVIVYKRITFDRGGNVIAEKPQLVLGIYPDTKLHPELSAVQLDALTKRLAFAGSQNCYGVPGASWTGLRSRIF